MPRRRKEAAPIAQRGQNTPVALVTAPAPPESDDVRQRALSVLDGYRAVEALHTPVVRWTIIGMEEWSYVSKEDALAEDEYVTDKSLLSFTVCQECGRMETDSSTAQDLDSPMPYELSEWPCPTYRALTGSGR